VAVVVLAWRYRLAVVPLLVLIATFPFIYAQSPFTWNWQDGRYSLYLAPFLALCFVGLAYEGAMKLPWHAARASAVLAGAVAIFSASSSPSRRRSTSPRTSPSSSPSSA